MDIRPQQLNCMIHSMRDLVAFHHVEPERAAMMMAQPVAFGFEVDLGTRDWWLGGYSGVHFQKPWFNAGLAAEWCDVTPGDFWARAEELQAEPRYPLAVSAIPFQTEWAFVSFGRHYGYLIGDIHTAVALAYDGKKRRMYIQDRMAPNVIGLDDFGRGWIDVELLAEAFDARLRILQYEITASPETPERSLLRVLETSKREMSENRDSFWPGPHVHIAEGLAGIDYFARVVRYFTPDHRDNPHSRYNFMERIPDGVNAIIGDRLLLLAAIQQSFDGEAASATTSLATSLERSVEAWDGVKREARGQAKASEPLDYAALADVIDLAADAERSLLESVAATLVSLGALSTESSRTAV
jgi:hypothetical protein